MGKYMKKSKTTTDDNRAMKVSEPITVGVRTRAAKTLALKRLNSSASASASDSALQNDSSCYLQLRSRRLEKPSSLAEPKQLLRLHKSGIKESGSRSRVDSVKSVKPVSIARSCNGDECFDNSASVEVSCGENSFDFESRHSTRESTPCNVIEDLEIMVTPGSSTRSMRAATKDYTRDRDIAVPTATELEEFFAYAEKQQQKLFMEKYNFDIVNDVPLTGRYEWVQVSP